jgi:hypothetical protein
MIIFITLRILAFDCSTTLILFANEAFIFKSPLFNILNSFDIYHPIFFLKVALRNPNGANIMNPNIMRDRKICGVC